MKEPPNTGPDDWFFDQHSQRWLRHSGCARWRTALAERRAARDPQDRADMLERLGLDPNRPARQVFRDPRPGGYPGGMRRPEVELSDEAASYVERHPAVIEKLAAGVPGSSSDAPDELRRRVRARVRARLHETRAYAESEEGKAAAEAWLAKYGLTGAQFR